MAKCDLKLYKDVKSTDDVDLLLEDLDAISKWCKDNNMILNAVKYFH